MEPEEFVALGISPVDACTLSPYARALKFMEEHAGCGGTRSLAKLLLSLWNSDAAFSFRECIDNLDDERTQLALACVIRFAQRGEDQELVEVGYRVHALYPRLWELGVAATEAKRTLLTKWDAEREREEA